MTLQQALCCYHFLQNLDSPIHSLSNEGSVKMIGLLVRVLSDFSWRNISFVLKCPENAWKSAGISKNVSRPAFLIEMYSLQQLPHTYQVSEKINYFFCV